MSRMSSHRRKLRDTRRAREDERERPYIETRNDKPRVQPEPTIPQFDGIPIRGELQDEIDSSPRMRGPSDTTPGQH